MTIADGQGIGTIVDDDVAAAPTVSISDASISEGNSGTKTVTLTLTLSSPAPASGTTSVRFATAPGTATVGSDYVNSTGTITFSPGQTSRTRSFTINGDTLDEPNETFFVDLNTPVGLTIADSRGVVTIVNDDAPALPSVSVNDVTITEGNSGTRTATFTFTLSAAQTSDVSLRFATAPGTATSGTDYIARNAPLTFTAGQITRTQNVTINGDTSVEGNETFFMNLSSPVGVTIADGQGIGTIVNDD